MARTKIELAEGSLTITKEYAEPVYLEKSIETYRLNKHKDGRCWIDHSGCDYPRASRMPRHWTSGSVMGPYGEAEANRKLEQLYAEYAPKGNENE